MDTQGQRQKRSSTETFDPPALEPCSKTKVRVYVFTWAHEDVWQSINT